MHLFITGGTGLLGSALVALAAARGHRITATFLRGAPSFVGCDWVRLDVRDEAAVQACVRSVRPDVIVHTAYVQNDPGMRETTTDGAVHVARAADLVGARLLHLSTDVLYDGERAGAYTEDDPLSPITAYGHAKADAEREVLARCANAMSVRTSLLYTLSPDDRHARFALGLASGALQGALFTDEMRMPLLVDELAAALLQLAGMDCRGRLNVVGREVLSRHALGRRMVRYHGGDPDRLPGARSADRPERRPRNCSLAYDRANALLGWVPRGASDVMPGEP